MFFIRKISLIFLSFLLLTPPSIAEIQADEASVAPKNSEIISITDIKSPPQFIDGTVRVSAEEIIQLVEKYEDLVFIDSRKKADVAKGYIEGSINLSHADIYGESLAKYIRTTKTPIIFYCRDENCQQSVKSAKIAAAEGYVHVYWFRGGIKEWENKGLPLVHPY